MEENTKDNDADKDDEMAGKWASDKVATDLHYGLAFKINHQISCLFGIFLKSFVMNYLLVPCENTFYLLITLGLILMYPLIKVITWR